MHHAQSVRTGLLCAVLFTIGCSGDAASGPPRATVRGKITLDGAPVTGGEIRFRPAAEGAETSVMISADGSYQIDLLENGPVVGPNKVFIEWYRPTDEKNDQGNPIFEPAIPAKYNTKTTLAVEMKAGKNEHNFNLESQ